jgi:hypothetical protein
MDEIISSGWRYSMHVWLCGMQQAEGFADLIKTDIMMGALTSASIFSAHHK